MLEELTFKPKRKQEIEEWVSKFREEIFKIPETKYFKVSVILDIDESCCQNLMVYFLAYRNYLA